MFPEEDKVKSGVAHNWPRDLPTASGIEAVAGVAEPPAVAGGALGSWVAVVAVDCLTTTPTAASNSNTNCNSNCNTPTSTAPPATAAGSVHSRDAGAPPLFCFP